jgi:hypothetical protein
MYVARHFTILVYPFRHGLPARPSTRQLTRLGERWRPWFSRLDREGLERALDDTYFFLPYVRKLLFPETVLLPAENASQQVPHALQLASAAAAELVRELSARDALPDGVLRLTYDPARVAALHPLHLEFAYDNTPGEGVDQFSAPMHLDWVDVILFPQQVGFLAMQVRLEEEHIAVDRLNDFLYYLRPVHPPTIDWQLPRWSHGPAETPLLFHSRDLVDFLLQGLTADAARLDPTLHAFLHNVRHGSAAWRYSAVEEGQVYGQAFRQYTYACLDAPPSATDLTAGAPAVPSALQSPKDAPLPFGTPVEQALYELATCTHAAHPDYTPHPSGLKRLLDKGHIALWTNWEGMALHDHVVFLGTRPSGFTLHALARNVEHDYFHLYLLTLYQKMRLSLLSGELMRKGATLHRNLREARDLANDFVMFRNHYWFAQVTLRPQGIELYRYFQQGLDVRTLYETINSEVRGLQAFYEGKAQRHVRGLLDFVAFVGLPTTILNGLFFRHLLEFDEKSKRFIFIPERWKQFAYIAGVVYPMVAVAWWCWKRLGKD